MRRRSGFLRYAAISLLLGAVFESCSFSAARPTPTPDAQGTALAQQLQQTMTALAVTVQAYSARQTQDALPTSTPTITPTATKTPGPLMIQDDFSADVGRWADCGQCRFLNGMMEMGPYPSNISAEGYITLCADCGVVQDYMMGVDVVYVEGASDRGFGLVLYEANGAFVDVELTTWQVYGAWSYDPARTTAWEAWNSLISGGWKLSGYLHPAQLSNRVEVEVKTANGRRTAAIRVNGQLLNTVEIPALPSRVGLVVGLHSLGIGFDNFVFVGEPID